MSPYDTVEGCNPDGCPRLIVLWVTTDCNLRCRYCYASGGENKAYMDWSVAKRSIDLMAQRSDHFKVQFAGGEPLMNMELIEKIISYSNDLGSGAGFQLQTNATLVSQRLASRLKELGIRVGVSLDGVPGVNDVLRPFADGRRSTGAVIAGLRNLAGAGVRVGITCVLTAANIEYLPSLVDLASYLGNVEGIALDPIRPLGRGKHEAAPDPAIAAKYLNAALVHADEIDKVGGHIVKFREIERMKVVLSSGSVRRHHCYFDACQSLMVKPGGDAYPCASLCHPEFHLGNILDDSFGDRYREKLSDALRLIKTPAKCTACPERGLCGGPCPAGIFCSKGSLELECAIKGAFIGHIRNDAVQS